MKDKPSMLWFSLLFVCLEVGISIGSLLNMLISWPKNTFAFSSDSHLFLYSTIFCGHVISILDARGF